MNIMDSSSLPLLSDEQESQQPLPNSQFVIASESKKRKKSSQECNDGTETSLSSPPTATEEGQETATTDGNGETGNREDNHDGNVAVDAENSIDDEKKNNNNSKNSTANSNTNRSRISSYNSSVTIPKSSLHQHLVCSLCKGYFRDPYTISDCLHTFCRSCLVMHFRKGSIDICCPTCNTRLGADPFRTSIVNPSQEIMPDRRLHEIVSKIFPHLKHRDEEAERRFYAVRGIEMKAEYAAVAQESTRGRTGEDDELQMSADDQLDIKLEPDESPPQLYQRLPSLRCPVLRLSGRAKIASLNKYLVMKLGLKDSRGAKMEIMCNGEPLRDDLSLTLIKNTRWLSNNTTLILKYRLDKGSD